MRNITIYLLLSLTAQTWAQVDTKEEFQKDRFDLATSFFEKQEYEKAIGLFYFVHHLNPQNDLGQYAIKKVDSLKPILRKNLTDKLIGNWKWIPKGGNWAIREDNLVGKMIAIKPNEILFFELYKNSEKWSLVKSLNIIYSDKIGMDSSFTEFIFSNKEIWEYSIDENSGELKTLYTGEETEIGRTELVCGNPVLYYFKLQ